jgi:small subunit ribosomal protein S9
MNYGTLNGKAYGTGKRKTAIARVLLTPGEGNITVNGRPVEQSFPRETSRMIIEQAFEVIEKKGQFDVVCNVCGGGVRGQAEAVRHGVARALLAVDSDTNRPPLKKAGFLTRDARKKERKKPGQPGARKKFQYSKR